MKCRYCDSELEHTLLDLGFSPPSNAYLTRRQLQLPEIYYPLRVMVCDQCWLVQTEDYASAEDLFDAEYAYFSSTSTSWLRHASEYADRITQKLNLTEDSLVVEVASNDGYLLKNFLSLGVPCLGIEPTAGTAAVAEQQGIPVLREFFSERLGLELAGQGRQADLIVGNNVYAHVPNINDFTRGLRALLKPGGTITLEFPHLMQLIEQVQFDTVYHEHFSYLSLGTVARLFESANLRIQDVEQLPTHGGSLRVYGCHAEDPRAASPEVKRLLGEEGLAGLEKLATYQGFQARANRVKDDLLAFLLARKKEGATVAGYGAAAKGNTLLNYAGIKPDLVSFVCDAAPSKQGKYLPGSHIPILEPSALFEHRPDYLLILPWNLSQEVCTRYAELSELGTRFVVAVPRLEVL